MTGEPQEETRVELGNVGNKMMPMGNKMTPIEELSENYESLIMQDEVKRMMKDLSKMDENELLVHEETGQDQSIFPWDYDPQYAIYGPHLKEEEGGTLIPEEDDPNKYYYSFMEEQSNDVN